MTLSFHPTTAPLFAAHRAPDAAAADMAKSFILIQDDDEEAHSEVTDALLGFAYDPLDPSNAALDDLLSLPPTATAAADSWFLAPIDGGGAGKRQCASAAGDYAWYAAGAGENRNNGGGTIDDLLLLSLPPSDAAAADSSAFLALVDRSKIQRNAGGGTHDQVLPALPPGTTNLVNDFVQELPPPPAPAVPVPTTALQVPPEPLVFVRGGAADDAANKQGVQNSAARQRRKRISEKTAELARLIPGAHRLNTAEMLEEGARHVKLLQAQVGMLALMRTAAAAAGGSSQEEEKMPPMVAKEQEKMQALLASGSVQERLAAEGKCLVPMKMVEAVAKDEAVKANAAVRRDLGRFVASLQHAAGQGRGQ